MFRIHYEIPQMQYFLGVFLSEDHPERVFWTGKIAETGRFEAEVTAQLCFKVVTSVLYSLISVAGSLLDSCLFTLKMACFQQDSSKDPATL